MAQLDMALVSTASGVAYGLFCSSSCFHCGCCSGAVVVGAVETIKGAGWGAFWNECTVGGTA